MPLTVHWWIAAPRDWRRRGCAGERGGWGDPAGVWVPGIFGLAAPRRGCTGWPRPSRCALQPQDVVNPLHAVRGRTTAGSGPRTKTELWVPQEAA